MKKYLFLIMLMYLSSFLECAENQETINGLLKKKIVHAINGEIGNSQVESYSIDGRYSDGEDKEMRVFMRYLRSPLVTAITLYRQRCKTTIGFLTNFRPSILKGDFYDHNCNLLEDFVSMHEDKWGVDILLVYKESEKYDEQSRLVTAVEEYKKRLREKIDPRFIKTLSFVGDSREFFIKFKVNHSITDARLSIHYGTNY